MLAQGLDLGMMILMHEFPPKPMLLPHKCHLFNGNVLGLRWEEIGKEGHEYHEKGKEDKQAKLQVTEHGKE